jgi:hypothetical protein
MRLAARMAFFGVGPKKVPFLAPQKSQKKPFWQAANGRKDYWTARPELTGPMWDFGRRSFWILDCRFWIGILNPR